MSYVLFLAQTLQLPFRTTFSLLTQLKKVMIRLLMYKGGYFYQTHRLGLATIMSGVVFSMLVFPLLSPITETTLLPVILAQNETDPSDNLVLFDLTRSTTTISNQDLRSEVEEYVVSPDDTISSIAEEYLVSVEALQYVNELGSNDLIHPGDLLKIPPVGGLVHQVIEDESISSIASLYRVSAQAIVDFNHIEEPFIIHQGDVLVVPDAQVPVQPMVLAVNTAQDQPTSGLELETINMPSAMGGFVMPTTGTISQYFWWGHPAIDIAGGCGTPIVTANGGTIVFAGWWAGGGGNSIFIDHGNGSLTKYAHLSGFERTSGVVNRGEIIGYTGATGRAFGCHLHFVVSQGDRPVNPLSVL